MIKCGINCTTSLPDGAPVWKKVVHIIWPDVYQFICDAKEGKGSEANNANNEHPLPPRLPELNDANTDEVESKVAEKLMKHFNDQLKLELSNHTDNIVEQVVSVVEKKLNLDVTGQQGLSQDNSARRSHGNQTTTDQSHHINREPQNVRILGELGNNNRVNSSNHLGNERANQCNTCDHDQQHRSTCCTPCPVQQYQQDLERLRAIGTPQAP